MMRHKGTVPPFTVTRVYTERVPPVVSRFPFLSTVKGKHVQAVLALSMSTVDPTRSPLAHTCNPNMPSIHGTMINSTFWARGVECVMAQKARPTAEWTIGPSIHPYNAQLGVVWIGEVCAER